MAEFGELENHSRYAFLREVARRKGKALNYYNELICHYQRYPQYKLIDVEGVGVVKLCWIVESASIRYDRTNCDVGITNDGQLVFGQRGFDFALYESVLPEEYYMVGKDKHFDKAVIDSITTPLPNWVWTMLCKDDQGKDIKEMLAYGILRNIRANFYQEYDNKKLLTAMVSGSNAMLDKPLSQFYAKKSEGCYGNSVLWGMASSAIQRYVESLDILHCQFPSGPEFQVSLKSILERYILEEELER